MTIREAVYSALTGDVQLQGLAVGGIEIHNIEAVDNPERGKPFLVTAWGTVPASFGSLPRRHDLLVWAHDDSADYSRIDAILDRVRILLVGIIHQGGISQVEFTGGSPDLYDDGFRTITRNYGFRVIGHG